MKEKRLLKVVGQLWLTPEEYAEVKNISLRSAYFHMSRGKVRTMNFKGKQLIRDESVRLDDVLNVESVNQL